MSNKDLKNRTPISNAVDARLWGELKKHAEQTGIPLSKLLDKAIEIFLESTKK